MTYETDAVFSNGAFVPVTPLAIPDGARVHLRVDEQRTAVESSKRPSRAELDEFLRLAAQLPVEGPNDGFSGVDHDRVLYGEP